MVKERISELNSMLLFLLGYIKRPFPLIQGLFFVNKKAPPFFPKLSGHRDAGPSMTAGFRLTTGA
jgi:hypothetical protein